jgi:predicted double-glycine peptidase
VAEPGLLAVPRAVPEGPGSPARPPPRLPAQTFPVPTVRQDRPYSCGPAALTAVLRYLCDWEGHESKLYGPLGTSPSDGTLPEKLAEVARDFGLPAKIEQRMTIERLRAALSGGQVVILELQAWPTEGSPPVPWTSRWDDGHYVVLIGMDAHYAYFMDPAVRDAYTYLELSELLPRWHDLNEIRKDPKLQRDYQLGVVIGPSRKAPKVVAGGLGRPRRLLKLE